MNGERWATLVVAGQLVVYAAAKVYMAAIGRLGLPGMTGPAGDGVWLAQLGNAGLGLLGAAVVLATLRDWGRVGRLVLLAALVLVLAAMAAGVVVLAARGEWAGWVQLPLVALLWPWLVWRYIRRCWRPVLPGAAWVALACLVFYGGLKLAWALGSEVLMAQTPLPPGARELLLGDGPVALAVHLASLLLAAAGVLVVLVLATTWRTRLPRWLLLGPLWLALIFLFTRAVLGFTTDLTTLTGLTSAQSRYLAAWDLGLWSPMWLALGAALLRLVLRSADNPVKVVG